MTGRGVCIGLFKNDGYLSKKSDGLALVDCYAVGLMAARIQELLRNE